MTRLASAVLLALALVRPVLAAPPGFPPARDATGEFAGSTPTAPLTGDICIGDVTTGVVCYDERGAQGQTVTTDVAPATTIVNGVDAAAAAATNKTGGNVEIAGGCATNTIAIDNYAVCGTDTVTITVDGTATVRTEGTNWTASVSNASTCTSLATAIDALAGVAATCSTSTVLITCDTTTKTLQLAESDAACTTVSANTAGSVHVRGPGLYYYTAAGTQMFAATTSNIQVGWNGGAQLVMGGGGGGHASIAGAPGAFDISSGAGNLEIRNSGTYPLGFAHNTGTAVGMGGGSTDGNFGVANTALTSGYTWKLLSDAVVGLYDRTPTNVAQARLRSENRLTATPTEPVTCDANAFGLITAVNDTNDGAVSYLCYCGQGADDSTYDWLRVSDNTACASF